METARLPPFLKTMTARQTAYVRAYFVAVVLLGLFIYRDYGVSWDESYDRVQGLVTAKYILSSLAPHWTENRTVFIGVPDFQTYLENDHGALFHTPFAFIEVLLGVDSRTFYLIKHVGVFLTFVLGLWSMYAMARIRFSSWKVGLFACTLLLLSPRIFADAFYNSKDLVFLSIFTFGVYTLVRFLHRPTLAGAVLMGFGTALTTDIRILGCVLFALALGMLFLEVVFGTTSKAHRLFLGKAAACYCATTIVFTIIGWPYLWTGPIDNFFMAFENMKRFRFDAEVLYLGQLVPTLHLPWHYAPVWIVVTTPVAYTISFVVGLFSYGFQLLRNALATLRTLEGRLDLLFAGWFFVPLLMVILLHSVIYDGWRHLYFIYPAMILLATRGIYAVWRASQRQLLLKRVALVLAMLVGAEVMYTVVRMVKAHPNQQVFFSFLSAPQAEQLFERDYWGVSYRKGLEWILAHDTSPLINVDSPFPILLENNLGILKPADRARFKINPAAKEVYYLTSYRAHPEPYPASVGNEVHAVRTNGIKILSVFYRW